MRDNYDNEDFNPEGERVHLPQDDAVDHTSGEEESDSDQKLTDTDDDSDEENSNGLSDEGFFSPSDDL